jgi:hypothetical protein
MPRTRKRTSPEPHDRCPECGVSVPRKPPAPPATVAAYSRYPAPVSDTGPPKWVPCDECAAATPGDRVAAMLARAGVEADPAHPATVAALRTLTWTARGQVIAAHEAAADRAASRHPAGSVSRDMAALAAVRALPETGTAGAQPWEHVDPRAVRRGIAEAHERHERAQRPTTPRRHRTRLPCGVCGVTTADSWHKPRTFVPTMSGGPVARRWPICRTCWTALRRAGGIIGSDRHRRRALADLGRLDVVSMGLPTVLRLYAEVHDDVAEPIGSRERWGWINAEDRRHLETLAPDIRPEEVRDRMARAAAAARRMDAAQTRARTHRSAVAVGYGGDRW